MHKQGLSMESMEHPWMLHGKGIFMEFVHGRRHGYHGNYPWKGESGMENVHALILRKKLHGKLHGKSP